MPLPPPSSRIFARYWQQYLRPHWAAMAGVLALMVIDGSVLGVVSALVEPLFDQVLLAGSNSALRAVAFGFLGLFLLRGLVSALARTLTAAITQRIAASTQGDMLAKIMALDIGFFQHHPPGVLLERVQGDTMAAQSVWTALLAGIGRDGLGLAALLWVAISVDPWWTLVTLCGFPLLVLPVIAVQGYMRRKAEQLREQAGLRATRLDEIFHGIQSVKLGRMEARQSARFALVLRTIRRAEVKLAASRATVPTLLDFATGVGFFSVLLVAGPDVAAGTRTPGEFMAFFTAIALVFQPLRRLGELSGVWQVAAVSVGRIYEILDMAPARARPTSPSPLLVPDPADDLVFDDVHFAHGAQEVLKGVSFTARAGQTTAIVGASGAGKTTVFHLLTGLLDPDAGTIRLGRLSLADLPLASQRALFATVSQEAAMFDETIAENILPGAGPQDAQRLGRAVSLAHVNEFLPRLPLGLDTAAGPRGSALSGGQRQRVAIARALVQEAPILLLDEATSALDGQSEAAVADALRGGAGRRTTIVIAHRLSTIRQADQIIVLEAGRVRESGSHDDLMARGGAYAGLHRLQGTP